MRSRSLVIIAALSLVYTSTSALDFPSRIGYTEGDTLEATHELVPGVVHRFESRRGPLAIHVIEADTSREELTLKAVKANDTLLANEKLLSMVERHHSDDARAIAGVNADFWGARGIPIGLFISEDGIWKHQHETNDGRRRPVFAVDETGRLFLDRPNLVMQVVGSNGETFSIDNINTDDRTKTTNAYTRLYGNEAPALTDDRKQIVLWMDGKVFAPNSPVSADVLSTDMRQAVTLDPNIIVLQTQQDIPEWMESGSTVTISATFEGLSGRVIAAVGGGPTLLKNGEIVSVEAAAEEGIGERFVTDKHPRTAIGVKDDGQTVVMVVVDGRQPGISAGVDLIELAEIMKELGCVEAMNLDGGGSSTMTVEREVVNFPSDAAGPRSVTNGIFVTRNAPLGEAASIRVLPNNIRIPVGSTLALDARPIDAAGEQVPSRTAIDYESSAPSVARVDDSGTVRAVAAGSATITAYTLIHPIIEGETNITVEQAVSLVIRPSEVLLASGESQAIKVIAQNAYGQGFFKGIRVADLTVPDFVRYDQESGTITALRSGTGELIFRLGSSIQTLPIAVDEFEQELLFSFDALPEQPLELLNAKNGVTSLTIEESQFKEGTAAVRFRYGMASGGTTKIAIPLNIEVQEAAALGLWVYGDGSEHFLRGELSDADGNAYLVDFSPARAGINWKDEWRYTRATLLEPALLRGTSSIPKAPMTLRNIYIVQPQEAAKKDGEIILDGLSALRVPILVSP